MFKPVRPFSPDLMYVFCPTCGDVCEIRLTVLTMEQQLVDLTSCVECNDHETIRAKRKLTRQEFVRLCYEGLIMFNYKR